MKQYIVDAFTDTIFTGNPAAICVMDNWPNEDFMKKMARENNLSETAFIVKEENGYRLRWFTPATEVELCGHATLASSFVILNYYEPDKNQVEFNTVSGKLTITRSGDLYQMDFPGYQLTEIPVTKEMDEAFGYKVKKAVLGLDLICVFENEEDVIKMNPDSKKLAKLPGRIQNASAKATKTDCLSRSFCPKLGIEEDPVCGSAHVQIASYWAKQLCKDYITAYQASVRGGYLNCKILENGRVMLEGKAVLFAVSEINMGVNL